ncbi:hypothetical protein BU14_0033s0052 [Porphyra umbilicalis]|uniref:Uncharacterized protein n=1 Tax=Porphyra umbilicalis TaxID=2786 RepID=A0A1X6PJ26_PORUM|nr:hypothetical protein BU14_0033s0052 [Porphyra umbilicalis]|eukprot:OSX80708.1 hypothetical protein BU14_0033s0052 [Porphyra umbilicalis]
MPQSRIFIVDHVHLHVPPAVTPPPSPATPSARTPSLSDDAAEAAPPPPPPPPPPGPWTLRAFRALVAARTPPGATPTAPALYHATGTLTALTSGRLLARIQGVHAAATLTPPTAVTAATRLAADTGGILRPSGGALPLGAAPPTAGASSSSSSGGTPPPPPPGPPTPSPSAAARTGTPTRPLTNFSLCGATRPARRRGGCVASCPPRRWPCGRSTPPATCTRRRGARSCRAAAPPPPPPSASSPKCRP